MRTRLCLLFAVMLATCLPSSAQGKNSYNIRLDLDPVRNHLRSHAEIDFAAPADGDSYRFLLNKSLRVMKLECSVCKSFQFATNEPSDYRYTPGSAPLRVQFNQRVKAGTPLHITVEYEGSLPPDRWGTNMLTPQWTELALYIGWFPFMPELRRFHYSLAVKAPADYGVSGSGVVADKGHGRWQLSESADTFDIVVIAARGMKTRTVPGSDELKVQYPPTISDKDAEALLALMQTSLADYESWFGPGRGGHLTLALNEREKGGGYARPGFISMPRAAGKSGALEQQDVRSLGHEVAHLWWNGADVTTWEDWLNESFAEYSSLRVVRHVLGQEVLEARLAKVRERARTLPPVWGIDRDSEAAYPVLYDKGAMLLFDLEQRMGEERFLSLAREFAQSKKRTTSDFLTLLEKAGSPEMRREFEANLKK